MKNTYKIQELALALLRRAQRQFPGKTVTSEISAVNNIFFLRLFHNDVLMNQTGEETNTWCTWRQWIVSIQLMTVWRSDDGKRSQIMVDTPEYVFEQYDRLIDSAIELELLSPETLPPPM